MKLNKQHKYLNKTRKLRKRKRGGGGRDAKAFDDNARAVKIIVDWLTDETNIPKVDKKGNIDLKKLPVNVRQSFNKIDFDKKEINAKQYDVVNKFSDFIETIPKKNIDPLNTEFKYSKKKLNMYINKLYGSKQEQEHAKAKALKQKQDEEAALKKAEEDVKAAAELKKQKEEQEAEVLKQKQKAEALKKLKAKAELKKAEDEKAATEAAALKKAEEEDRLTKERADKERADKEESDRIENVRSLLESMVNISKGITVTKPNNKTIITDSTGLIESAKNIIKNTPVASLNIPSDKIKSDATEILNTAIGITKGMNDELPNVEPTPNVEPIDANGIVNNAIEIIKEINTNLPIVKKPIVGTDKTHQLVQSDVTGIVNTAIEIAKGINTKKQTDEKVDTNIQKTSSKIIIPTTDMIETAIHIIKNITDTIKPVDEKTSGSITIDSTGLVDSAVNILSHVNVSQIVESLSSIEKPTINITGLLENAVEIINKINTTTTTTTIVNPTIESSGIIDTAIKILSNENISPGSINGTSNVNNSSYGEPSYLYTVNEDSDKITDVHILTHSGNDTITDNSEYNNVITQFLRKKKPSENVEENDKTKDGSGEKK